MLLLLMMLRPEEHKNFAASQLVLALDNRPAERRTVARGPHTKSVARIESWKGHRHFLVDALDHQGDCGVVKKR